ncbi:MAG: hypothetical protein ABIR96_01735 [Bdellovibrionota bacterium]
MKSSFRMAQAIVAFSLVIVAPQGHASPSPADAILIEEHPQESHQHGCQLIRKTLSIVDPVRGSPARVIFDHYTPEAGDQLANVIILPPTGGENTLDRLYARDFCNRGLGALLVKTWTYDTESSLDFSTHDNGYRRAVHAVEAIMKFVPGRIGILGTSLGSLYASVLLASEPRIESAVLIVSGAPLWTILAKSQMGPVKAQREQRMKNLGIASVDAYEAQMKKVIHFDVTRFLPLSREKKVFMVNALKDKFVASQTQQALWRALGRPAKVDINAGHLGTVFRAYLWHHQKIEDFLVQNLEDRP